jgi:hypothetical protein
MFKKLPNLFSLLLASLSLTAVTAQEYQTMPITTGLNADVIANGIGLANTSTTHTVDADDYVYMANNFQQTAASALPAVGLPSTGIINSIVAATSGLSYQLGPLSGNNALRLDATTTTGTVTFATPIPVATLYMLGATGNGPASVTVLVNFSDGTSQSFGGTVVPDWFFITSPPPAISGFGRLGRTSNILDNQAGNPRLYQIAIAIPAASQPKNVTNIQVTKTTTGGVVSIFAFSADRYVSCKSPLNITSVSTAVGGNFSWTAPSPAPASGYEYYVTASATPPTDTTTPTGSVAAGVTTVSVTSLVAGQSYYFWLRSNCGGTDKGLWKMKAFTAGQISATFTTGDISTSLNATPTTTSTTTCPGTLSIVVPPGYKIASVATNYTMTAASTGQQSQQRSLLYTTTNNTGEAAVTAGPAVNGTGVATYNRSGLTFANNLTGTVNFELRAWRTSGTTTPDCSTTLNKVTNNSWTVTVTYELGTCTTPAAPTVVNQTLCPGTTVADLQSTGIVGAVYKWYNVPTGGTPLASTTTLVSGNYYVTQTVGTCESPVSVANTVTLAPTALPTASPQTFCNGATVANLLTTSGTNLKWYDVPTAGAPLAGTALLVNGNYYLTQTVNGCESARATIAITVNTTPVPVSPTQTFCQGGGSTVANLQATLVAGATVRWYASETATTPLASTALLGSGTYYVSQVLGVCESFRLAVPVAVAVIVAPSPAPQQLCTGATVANLVGGTSQVATYKWFDSQASTTPLAADTPVVTGTYFVTQTISTCESQKASVQVTISDVTVPVVADQEFCAGATVAALQATPATGATIRWYATETSTTPLTATTALASGTYYVSQKLNTCESGRDTVEVIVHEVVAAPANTPLLVCTGSTFGDLTIEVAEGAIIKWYATNSATTQLSATATPVSGTTYYVSQTIGNCESARTAVVVSFNYIAVPTSESFIVCNGTTFGELEAEGSEGATFNWYATLDTENQLDVEAVVTPGTFYLSQNVDGCESGRVPVAVATITTTAPSPTPQQAFCGEALVSDLVGGTNAEYDVQWYSPEGNAVAEGDALVTGTYTVSQTANGCESQAVPVAVIVSALPDAPAGAEEQDFTAGETVGNLDLEFAEGAIVEWYFLNEDVWISIPAGTPLVDGGVYGVKQTVGNCESDIKAVTVNLMLDREDFELSNLKIYPNPSSDIVNIEGKETLTSIVVINLLGQKVLQNEVNAASAQINIADLPRATYILQVYGANGGTATYKIVKQ